jgi:predicted enzyme related to lactoylglutathione lyase
MMFDFNPDVFLTGGIQRVPENTGTLSTGRGGICMYWFVEDVDKAGELIEQNGGKMLSDRQKEGESGIFRYFEDTEGNVGAVYMMV